MPAVELMNYRIQIADNSFTSVRILQVEPPVQGSEHQYKYSLACIVDGRYLLRYDNERGKGDHNKHIGDREYTVTFISIEALITRFQKDITPPRR